MATFEFSTKRGTNAVIAGTPQPGFGNYSMVFFPATFAPYQGIMGGNQDRYAEYVAENIASITAIIPPAPATCEEKEHFLMGMNEAIKEPDLLDPTNTPMSGFGYAAALLTLKSDDQSPAIIAHSANVENAQGTGDIYTVVGLALKSDPSVMLHGFRADASVVDGAVTSISEVEIGGPFTIPKNDIVVGYSKFSNTFGDLGLAIRLEGRFLDNYGADAISEIWPECGSPPPPSDPISARSVKISLLGSRISSRIKCKCKC